MRMMGMVAPRTVLSRHRRCRRASSAVGMSASSDPCQAATRLRRSQFDLRLAEALGRASMRQKQRFRGIAGHHCRVAALVLAGVVVIVVADAGAVRRPHCRRRCCRQGSQGSGIATAQYLILAVASPKVACGRWMDRPVS